MHMCIWDICTPKKLKNLKIFKPFLAKNKKKIELPMQKIKINCIANRKNKKRYALPRQELKKIALPMQKIKEICIPIAKI